MLDMISALLHTARNSVRCRDREHTAQKNVDVGWAPLRHGRRPTNTAIALRRRGGSRAAAVPASSRIPTGWFCLGEFRWRIRFQRGPRRSGRRGGREHHSIAARECQSLFRAFDVARVHTPAGRGLLAGFRYYGIGTVAYEAWLDDAYHCAPSGTGVDNPFCVSCRSAVGRHRLASRASGSSAGTGAPVQASSTGDTSRTTTFKSSRARNTGGELRLRRS